MNRKLTCAFINQAVIERGVIDKTPGKKIEITGFFLCTDPEETATVTEEVVDNVVTHAIAYIIILFGL
jgi:hypothetical protein